MKKYLTEFDEIQAALSRVPLNENVMPYYRGRLVENEDAYNKMQKLLGCKEMSKCHKYLYELDIEDLDDEDVSKIDKLFDMGVKRGYIDDSFQKSVDADAEGAEGAEEEVETPVVKDGCAPCAGTGAVQSDWTVLYSATKNGETKCGECYSDAPSAAKAKADCIAKLSQFGYDNISILACEAGSGDFDDFDDGIEGGDLEEACGSKNPYS